MTDSVDKAVKRIKEKYDEQRAVEEKQLLDEKLKNELGSQFFADLHRLTEQLVQEFSSKMGGSRAVMSITSINNDSFDITVTPTVNRSSGVSVRYSPATQQIVMKASPGNVHVTTQQLFLAKDRRSMFAESISQISGGVPVHLGVDDFAAWVFDDAVSQV